MISNGWDSQFSLPNGLSGQVSAMLASGTNVYVSGSLGAVLNAPPNNYLLKFDTLTQTWTSLGTVSADGAIRVMALSGSDLYVGGFFTTVDVGGTNVPANNVAKLNLTTGVWSALGTGGGQGVSSGVYAMTLSGSDLYVGGFFLTTNVGGATVSVNRLAKFNTVTGVWSALGTGGGNGVNSNVLALAVSGSDLYVGGSFATANVGGTTVTANGVAKFNTLTGIWSALGSGGGQGIGNGVQAMAISGNDLYVGGNLSLANIGGTTVPVNNLAKFNTVTGIWSAVGSGGGNGVDADVSSLLPSGNELYVGGGFTTANVDGATVVANRIAKVNTSTGIWSALGTGGGNGVSRGGGASGEVSSLAMIGSRLYVAGSFTSANEGGSAIAVGNIAKFDTATSLWSGLTEGTGKGLNDVALAMAVNGTDIYVGGIFSFAGSVPVNGIAKFDTLTNTWSALGTGGGNGVDGTVQALAVSGGDLYVGGDFTLANVGGATVAVNHVAKVNLATGVWSALGTGGGNGVSSPIRALIVSGGDLYVGGGFTTANVGGTTVNANRVAKFTPATGVWTGLGTGGGNGVNGPAYALAVSGGNLCVGGTFATANVGGTTVSANNIARVNLTTGVWSVLGTGGGNGVSGGFGFSALQGVYALATNGSDLYVGGNFATANTGGTTVSANYIAKVNLTAGVWSALGTGGGNGLNLLTEYWPVSALALNGNDLYIAGAFTQANVGGTTVNASSVAKFNTTNNTWSALADSGGGNGVNYIATSLGLTGNDVFVGGFFSTAGDNKPSANIGRFHTNTAPTIAAQAGVSRQQGSPASNAQIATVNDAESGAGGVTVTVTSANPANGITVSNIVNAGGTVTADVIAACGASNASFTLRATDGDGSTATTTLSVNVTANTPPVLTYSTTPVPIASGGSVMVSPLTGPSDNGNITSVIVSYSTFSFFGIVSVNSAGVVSISNAGPAGTHTINVGVTDNCGATTTRTFTVTVSCLNSLTVNNLGDSADAVPGNGICETAAGNGVCTLRAALQEAHAQIICTPFTITLAVTGTISLNAELPSIFHPDLTLNGPGAPQLAIRSNAATPFRIFVVDDNNEFSVKKLTINGLTLRDSELAVQSGPGGQVMVNNCVVTNNQSGLRGDNDASLTVNNSVIANNTMADGFAAGVWVLAGTLTMTNCTISGNTITGTTDLQASALIVLNGSATLTNCTISDNTGNQTILQAVFPGGPITSTLTLTNCTVTGNTLNSATTSYGVLEVRGDGKLTSTLQLKNTLVAGNTVGLGANFRTTAGSTVTSLGNNLDSDGSSGFSNGVNGNLVGTLANPLNALLASLGNYGGTTQTVALLPGSPAINAGTASGAPVNDQRGIARVGNVDIGAFESRGFTLAVSSGNNQAAAATSAFANPLSVTVTSANSEPVNGGKVTFTPPGSGASASLAGNPATIGGGTATTGIVTANAITGGPYNVSANANGAAAVNFALTNICPTISVTNPATAAGTAFSPFSQTFTQTGGIGTTTFSTSSTLPTGLTLSSSGVLSGTPTQTGTFPITVKATDSNSCMGTGSTYNLVINLVACINSLTVNNLGDGPDATPGNGLCETAAGNGVCTLRAAMQEANALARCSPLTINFNVTGTINTTSVLPNIVHPNLTINGPGADQLTVRGAGTHELFRISGTANLVLQISGLTLTNGFASTATNGAAIEFNSMGGMLTVTGCALTGNSGNTTTTGQLYSHMSGGITITNSTISGNPVGRGVIVDQTPLTLTNTTINGNAGHGLYFFPNVVYSVTLLNCTIASNMAGGMGINAFLTPNLSVTLKNTLVANNGNPQINLLSAQIISQGNNLVSDGSLTPTAIGDLINTNPLFAPLGNYGGTTQTLALLPGSPAINAGTSSGAPATDQRGIARVGNVDIGAFESRGFTQTLTSGNNQSTPVNSAFANPLTVTLSSAFNEPINGGRVTFTAPGTGASAALVGSPATVNGSGQAGVTATANAITGTYQVTAATNGSANATSFTLTNTCPTITVTVPATNTGTVGTSFSQTFTQVGGIGATTFSVSAGTLPTGLTLSAAGALAGTPTQAGSFALTVQATDANGCLGTQTYTLTIACQPLTVNPSTATLPEGRAGTPYSQTFTAAGNLSAVSFSLSAGSLPSGLTLSSGGVLAGTPSVFGAFNFTVRATEANGCFGERAYSLTLLPPCGTLTISPASLANGFQTRAYNQTLTASGSTAPYSFAVTGGSLPGGLTLASGGALTGTPTAAGTFSFTVTATDSTGCTGTRAYTLMVSGDGLQFYPLAAPVRLLDTRTGQVACTQPNAPIAGQTSLTQAGRSVCGIPANAVALTGNLTTVNSGGGFLTLYPSNAAQPTVASVNYAPNEIINNVFTVGLGTDGAFKIFAFNTTDVVVDVTGYYAPPVATGLFFHPLPKPIRLLETRAGQTGCTTPGAPLQAGDAGVLTQQARVSCDGVTIPSGALAIVGNATTVNPQGVGFLTLFPGNATRPLAAASNYGAGQIVNGPFSVGLAPNGEFKLYTFATTDLVVDVLGYYSTEVEDANGAGLLFSPLAKPVRLLETRAGQPVGCNLPGAPLNGQQEYTQTARGTCDGVTVPTNALGVVGNATVVQPLGPGFLTLWPSSAASRPTVATANYSPGEVTNRHFIVGLGSGDGAFKMYSFATSNLVLDLSGYFAP